MDQVRTSRGEEEVVQCVCDGEDPQRGVGRDLPCGERDLHSPSERPLRRRIDRMLRRPRLHLRRHLGRLRLSGLRSRHR